ncbi:MAG: DUF1572 domain-containing protein [Thermoanaerobaculia bacterium]|nr:hypothetical protein [Thermoanaerobaculia bacterium]MCK6681591.1 DUF1572 domain-containing protein [Thermoanaerobaculia bacterium]
MDASNYLRDVSARFVEAKAQADGALAQVPVELWFHRLDPESNSLATLILHLSGNMKSRWTDFLTTDGEKPDRHRDSEFEDLESEDGVALTARWEEGWSLLFSVLRDLGPEQLDLPVRIRSQTLTVASALNRQLTHYSYHVGQMVFLAKHLARGQWQTLSVPRGGSERFNRELCRRSQGT